MNKNMKKASWIKNNKCTNVRILGVDLKFISIEYGFNFLRLQRHLGFRLQFSKRNRNRMIFEFFDISIAEYKISYIFQQLLWLILVN